MNNLQPVEYKLSDTNVIYGHPSPDMDIMRLTLSFEAGSYYQRAPLIADAANKLFSEGTSKRTHLEVAEFLDYRGAILDKAKGTYSSDISVYTLRKYAPDVIGLLCEMLNEPRFAEQELSVYCARERQQLQLQQKKTKSHAMRLFHQAVYGQDHPLARFADEKDVDNLSRQTIKDFYDGHYSLDTAHVLLAGGYDDNVVSLCHKLFGGSPFAAVQPYCVMPPTPSRQRVCKMRMESGQTSIRIGRLLPLKWDSPDYAPFMILNTILGGYFGSRLMANIREDKGYTYGVQSLNILGRDSIMFVISTEVGNETTDAAIQEVYNEIDRLCQQMVSDDELQMVCHYMEGDFIRTIDGVFERSERFLQMASNSITERFTDNYFNAFRQISPSDIQRLAQKYLQKKDLMEIVVGAGA